MPSSFIRDEAGAVTVDWVVLTAALVGLGLAVMTVVSEGIESTSNDIDGTLRADDIISTSFASAGFLLSDQGGLFYDDARVADLITTYGGYDAATLQSTYTSYQSEYADGGHYGIGVGYAVDELGAIEEAASNSGVTLDPGDGATYEAAYTAYLADNPT